MKKVINPIITAHVDLVTRTGNNVRLKITARDKLKAKHNLGQYPNLSWRFSELYNKSKNIITFSIGKGITIVDGSAEVIILAHQLPPHCNHDFRLSDNLDLFAGEHKRAEKHYNTSFKSYADNATAEGEGLIIDIFGDITSAEFDYALFEQELINILS